MGARSTPLDNQDVWMFGRSADCRSRTATESAEDTERAWMFGGSADWKSTIQQVGNPRYGFGKGRFMTIAEIDAPGGCAFDAIR